MKYSYIELNLTFYSTRFLLRVNRGLVCHKWILVDIYQGRYVTGSKNMKIRPYYGYIFKNEFTEHKPI